MVEQLYLNTTKEMDEVKIIYCNKETEAEQKEEDHRKEIRVYNQKVKTLEYEQDKSNRDIDKESNVARDKENEYFE